MVLRHVQEANTLVNRQNIRYNILSGTLVPYRAINRHISTKQDLPRCSLCGFAVDICKRYVVLFNVKIFKRRFHMEELLTKIGELVATEIDEVDSVEYVEKEMGYMFYISLNDGKKYYYRWLIQSCNHPHLSL